MEDIKMGAAIFDVDGTLLDSMGIWENIGAKYLRSLGAQPEEGLRNTLFTMSIEEGASYMNEHYHLHKTIPEVIQGVLDTVRDFYYYEAELKEGAQELLEHLYENKIPMAVATSSERDHIERAFERLGILKYFKKIYTCSEEATSKKNSPLIYQRASEYLGAAPEDTWIFEDVLHAIQIAKKAGYHIVGVYDSFSERDQVMIEQMSDIYLKSLKDYRTKEKKWR